MSYFFILFIVSLVFAVTSHSIFVKYNFKRRYIKMVIITSIFILSPVLLSYSTSISKGNVFSEYKEVFGKRLPIIGYVAPNSIWKDIDLEMYSRIESNVNSYLNDNTTSVTKLEYYGTYMAQIALSSYNTAVYYYNIGADKDKINSAYEKAIHTATSSYISGETIEILMFDKIIESILIISISYIILLYVYNEIYEAVRLAKRNTYSKK